MPQRDREFYNAIDRKRSRYEAKYFKLVGQSLYSSVDGYLKEINALALTASQAQAMIETKFPIEPIESMYKGLVQDVGVSFAEVTFNGLINAKKSKRKAYTDFLSFVSDFVNKYAVVRSRLIADSIKRDLQSVLSFAVLEGWSIDRISDTILELRLGFESWRAKRIARTEVISASNYGSKAGAKATGFRLQKEWIATNDSRTRRTPEDQFDHSDMNGVIIPENEFFQVPMRGGGFEPLELPGDYEGSAGNVINCRCTIAWIPVD